MSILLFDLFGVIARLQSSAGRARLEQVAGVSGAPFWDAYWESRPAYDRGEQGGPEYWQAVGARLDVEFGAARIADLIAADLSSWSEVDEEMVAFLRVLSDDGAVLGLLSNIPEELAAHYERRHAWLDLFAVRAFSCRIGHAKPEAAAYRWCALALRVLPTQVLFIDDRAENVVAAEAAGMRAHRFTSLATLRSLLTARRS